MDLNASQLSALKEKELDLLKSFVSVCQQLNLTYFIVGGTLLGAVRHKGFIPWDDDIDIAMLRSDYEIFIAKAQELLPEYIFLQTHDTDPEYLANFAKLRHSGTAFIETAVKHRKINHGIFIDIFPLDYYPNSPKEIQRFQFLNRLYTQRIHAEFFYNHKLFKQKFSHALVKILIPSVQRALRKRNALFQKYPASKLLASHCGAWGEKEIIPAHWCSETTTVEFETLQLSAPRDYDAWLTHYYGDYMQLPPVEKRINHHFTEVIDSEKSYKEYI